MSTSPAGSWDQVRQSFADQFEPDGVNFVYRRSQKGEAIRVSAGEYANFIEEFDRNVSRSKLIMYVGLGIVLGGMILFSLIKDFDLKEPAIFAGIGIVFIPYFAFYRWAWGAPSRALVGRVPVAADPHQAAQNAESDMLKCFYAQAASLDDHASDASTIAQGVVSACHPQIDDWKYAYSAEYRPLAATEFRDSFGTDDAWHGY